MSRERTQVVRIRTPEGVAFTFRVASPALRAAAVIVDWGLIAAAWSLVSLLISLSAILDRDLAEMAAVIGYFLLSQGYVILAEWRWRGQTLGKRCLRLRVVDAAGLRLTFPQVLVRNLLRFIDGLPAMYLVGGTASLLSARGQRLGDLAANTIVVWEPVQVAPDFTVLQSDKYNSLRDHPAAVARLRQSVSVEESRAAWSALARRDDLEPEARIRLFRELAEYFGRVGAVPSEASDGISDEQFVRNVVGVLYLAGG